MLLRLYPDIRIADRRGKPAPRGRRARASFREVDRHGLTVPLFGVDLLHQRMGYPPTMLVVVPFRRSRGGQGLLLLIFSSPGLTLVCADRSSPAAALAARALPGHPTPWRGSSFASPTIRTSFMPPFQFVRESSFQSSRRGMGFGSLSGGLAGSGGGGGAPTSAAAGTQFRSRRKRISQPPPRAR